MGFLSKLTKNHPMKVIIFGLLYIVSPLDFVPDFLLPFGLLDDAAILGLVMGALRQLMSKKATDAEKKKPADDPDVIDVDSEKL